ncbi:MAG: SH3 domain-containing protein [Neorhizobium sp.]|nr:SH3 domain-containing protein [Neorhizobium sp.]
MKKILLSAAALSAMVALPSIADAAVRGYATANVNMRSGPSTAYPAVTVIPVGAPVSINGCMSSVNWCDVSFVGGRGWVSGNYVQASYQSNRVYVAPDYYRGLGIPSVTFDVDNYWGRYYRGRDFYRDRGRWRDYDWRADDRYQPPPPPPPPRWQDNRPSGPPPDWDRNDNRRPPPGWNGDNRPRPGWDRNDDRRPPPPDRGPDMRPDRGPDMRPDRGPDMRPDRGPDMRPDRGPDMRPDRGPDRNPDRAPDRGPDRRPPPPPQANQPAPPPPPQAEQPPRNNFNTGPNGECVGPNRACR